MGLNKTALRYPGGKQKLAPFLAEIIKYNKLDGGEYVEPYAGGAGAAIELLISKTVSRIHLNDSSYPIYCYWRSILHESDKFCRLIMSASLTIEEWHRQREILLEPQNYSLLEVGFSTFYLNRCNRSGVISGGVIGGIEQTGEWKMDARFNRAELISRIESIAFHREKIQIQNLDAEEYLKQYLPTTSRKTLVYLDPPYFEKSRGLYLNTYKKEDHLRLSTFIQRKLKKKWVLSYDAAPEIISYYSKRQHFLYDLQYNAASVYKGKEIFVFSDNLQLPKTSSLVFIDKSLKRIKKTHRAL